MVFYFSTEEHHASKRLFMRKPKEILRLDQLGLSHRKIAHSWGVFRPAVGNCLTRFVPRRARHGKPFLTNHCV